MGRIISLCVSTKKGTAKSKVDSVKLIENHGIKGDAHAGNWHRQISLLAVEKINMFRGPLEGIKDGDFGENIIVEGIDLSNLPIGTLLESESVLLEISQIGKKCHDRCEIYHRMGDCIMPREGVFAKVLRGGTLKTDDPIHVIA